MMRNNGQQSFNDPHGYLLSLSLLSMDQSFATGYWTLFSSHSLCRRIMKQDDCPLVLLQEFFLFSQIKSTAIVLTLKQVLTPLSFAFDGLLALLCLLLLPFFCTLVFTRNRSFPSSISSSLPPWKPSRKCKFSLSLSLSCSRQARCNIFKRQQTDRTGQPSVFLLSVRKEETILEAFSYTTPSFFCLPRFFFCFLRQTAT